MNSLRPWNTIDLSHLTWHACCFNLFARIHTSSGTHYEHRSHQNAGFSIWVFKKCSGVTPPDSHSGRWRPPPAPTPSPAFSRAWGASAPVMGPKPWSPSTFQPWLRPCNIPPPGLASWQYLFARWHLFQHVGYLRHQQVDLWPWKRCPSHVWRHWRGLPLCQFLVSRSLCSRLRPDVRNSYIGPKSRTERPNATDVRQHHRLMPPPLGGALLTDHL